MRADRLGHLAVQLGAADLVRQGEAFFGQPLKLMVRGKGSKLTALGEERVWADRRIAARVSPALESLASELVAEIGKVLASSPSLPWIFASRSFAVRVPDTFLAAANVPTELRFCGSQAAVASHPVQPREPGAR